VGVAALQRMLASYNRSWAKTEFPPTRPRGADDDRESTNRGLSKRTKQKAPAAASVMHTEALQLLQLDLLGQVEPAAPFKNHESTAIWCQITHPSPATPASPALSTDFQLKIWTEKRTKSTPRIPRTPNSFIA
jgi:hypothetical protein